jgi:hypothetical protein
MRKALIVLMVSLFLSASWSLVFGAEMAKEGESNIKSAMSFTFKTLPMEKERVEMQMETFGVTVEAKEDCPLFGTTIYVLGESHTYKGVYEQRGFARYTRPDGDQIFFTFEAKGNVQGERKTKLTVVGGTGKCAGITGEMEATPALKGLLPPKEGVGMMVSVGKFNWKMP